MAFLYARWLILGLGAVAGVAVYMKDRNHYFGTFHLVAFFCVVSAIVSALVSAYPEEAILKALSLALLFVYAGFGGRAAGAMSQPELFFRRLLVGCEILTVFTAISYFAFRWEFFGNPNSLGAVMAVAVIPLMLWGLISAETVGARRRLGAELALAVLLLMSSFARAAIGAALVSCVLLCLGARQYRLLAKGIAASLLLAVAAATLVPQPADAPQWTGSEAIGSMFLYKGHEDSGILESRRGVWGQTWDVIKENPWFGSGYGTSVTTSDMTKMAFAKNHIDSWVIREHGNSYLAITEWVGLLGVVPFLCLVLLAIRNLAAVLFWMRRSGDYFSPAVPAAAVVIAGLVHATFEDWMFAVGYHVCVFFWSIAFILVDLAPRPAAVYAADAPFSIADQQFQTAPAASVP
jgi:O-antigen ligase